MLRILMADLFLYLKNSQVDFIPEASERRGLYPSVTPSHLHTFSRSHLLIFTSAHLQIFYHIRSSSHLLIFTPARLHVCSSSDLLSHMLIFTPALFYTCSPSHLFILRSSLTSAHFHSLHMSSSSHLLIFTSAPLTCARLQIFSNTCSSSYLIFFTSSLTFACCSSHLLPHILPHLHIFSPFFPFSLSRLFIFLSLGQGWCRRGVTKREPFCTK